MYVQLTIAERLKDLRVIDKKLTLEQLAEQTGFPSWEIKKQATVFGFHESRLR